MASAHMLKPFIRPNKKVEPQRLNRNYSTSRHNRSHFSRDEDNHRASVELAERLTREEIDDRASVELAEQLTREDEDRELVHKEIDESRAREEIDMTRVREEIYLRRAREDEDIARQRREEDDEIRKINSEKGLSSREKDSDCYSYNFNVKHSCHTVKSPSSTLEDMFNTSREKRDKQNQCNSEQRQREQRQREQQQCERYYQHPSFVGNSNHVFESPHTLVPGINPRVIRTSYGSTWYPWYDQSN